MYRKITSSLIIVALAFLTLPAEVFGAIAFSQSTTCNGNTTPLATTNFAGSVVAGDIIVVTTVDDGGTGLTVTSMTDTGGNTYTKIADSAANDTGTTQMWWAKVVTGGSSFNVSITWNNITAARLSCVAQEFNGFTGTPTFDKISALANGTSVSPLSATTGTLTNANELIVGGFGHYSTISAFSLGTGYTNLGTVNVANAASAQESKVVAITTAVTAGATIAASREWNAYAVTFYDLQSAVAATPKPVMKVSGGKVVVSASGRLAVK